ncbi:type II toxin-antitoxin system VapC family toxin [Acidiphilium acidophilum]|uniref:Ribonuclease VapC n=1 Tax=Acidiphilium acidophilum TaxID=76588 RepID=A0AAW9DLF8_ACIAO|nr:type II toxin-antitoxin system VapC family toxin [Acidiphilium acidophilum]MDX5929521.1 type II toxin-antitoxin system VapC family toxin [Acidiphilium acidophilum]GBR77127.1 PilT domain-containing protein [Acidiphilium acidophilum DSM 700]
MLILDTNVLSEIMRPRPALEVAAWLARQPDDLLYTTAISQAEVLSGLAIMPEGRRHRELEAAARGIFTEDFEDRILPFDTDATAAYAEIVAARRRTGRPTAPLDLMIAAVAVSHNASVVTRDTKGFDGCGVTLVNPWQVS